MKIILPLFIKTLFLFSIDWLPSHCKVRLIDAAWLCKKVEVVYYSPVTFAFNLIVFLAALAVMTQWSVKIILVCNTDLFKKNVKNWSVFGLYFEKLVCIFKNVDTQIILTSISHMSFSFSILVINISNIEIVTCSQNCYFLYLSNIEIVTCS